MSSNKRKRTSAEEGETDGRPAKSRALESGHDPREPKDKKSGGDRRQVRSERKRKRAVQARQNAINKITQRNAASTSQDVTTEDSIRTGQDFVPLIDSSAKVKSFKKKSEKRRSPRAIRKEAKQQKIESALAEVDEEAGNSASSRARFICFVGNLPYTATVEQLQAHFSKLIPKAIRLSTDKETGKGKGFAFLEFDDFDKMKTCLKLYHHSMFDPDGEDEKKEQGTEPGQRDKTNRRKINVELTVGGGGGKSAGRKEKISKKNKKLNEERARDWNKKKREAAEHGKHSKAEKEAQTVKGANTELENSLAQDNRGDIHPSRLSRVRG